MQLAGSGSAIGPARFDHATAPSTMTPDAGWPGLRPARRRAKDAPTIGGCGDAGSRRKASDGRSRLLSEIPLGDKWCRCPACAKRIGTRMAPIGVYINVRPSAEALQTNTAHLSLTDVTVFSTQGTGQHARPSEVHHRHSRGALARDRSRRRVSAWILPGVIRHLRPDIDHPGHRARRAVELRRREPDDRLHPATTLPVKGFLTL